MSPGYILLKRMAKKKHIWSKNVDDNMSGFGVGSVPADM